MTSSETVKFIVAMIIMMNPLGSLSIFLDLTAKSSFSAQRKMAVTTGITILIIMVSAIWTGKDLLDLLGITIPSFRVAGGLILLLMGLSMLQSKESPVSHTAEDDAAARERHSVAIVPMALPVIIGPGAISTLIIAAGDFPQFVSKVWISLLCLLLTIGMGLMLYFAVPIARLVGVSIIKVITRIMGMIIMAIAVGMLANGLMGLFPALN
ncbi:MAG: NAAT family transporter [Gammaproteobacteria bacterium]|nr:NAAT family transporter [Gammaproteobacteria bacterium]